MTNLEWIPLVIVASGCGRSAPPAIAEEAAGAGSGSSSAIIITGANAASSGPRLVDDMVPIEAGLFWGRRPLCPDTDHRQDVAQSIGAYRIDRRTASCGEFADCVAAGGCKANEYREDCFATAAVVALDQAQAYCAWRGTRLPSYAEWQRAVRGRHANLYSMGQRWDPDKACPHPTVGLSADETLRRCEHVSEAGLIFTTENVNASEWTRDTACVLDDDGTMIDSGQVTPYLLGVELNVIAVSQPLAEIRCARDP